jgi:hypothetical protein
MAGKKLPKGPLTPRIPGKGHGSKLRHRSCRRSADRARARNCRRRRGEIACPPAGAAENGLLQGGSGALVRPLAIE